MRKVQHLVDGAAEDFQMGIRPTCRVDRGLSRAADRSYPGRAGTGSTRYHFAVL